MTKNCLTCGKEFSTQYSIQQFCCRTCKLQNQYIRRRKTNRNAPVCAIGTERIRHCKGGSYVEVKTKQPKEWTPKNIYVYEKTHNVKVVRGKEIIRCLDGNNRNSSPENLCLLSRRENGHVNRFIKKYNITVTPEIMKLIILYVKVRKARVEAAKKHGLVYKYAHSTVIKTDSYKRAKERRLKGVRNV